MIVGIPTEVKADEYRVALRPVGAQLLSSDGHQVLIQRGAGNGSGISDDEFVAAGAHIVETAKELFERAELIVKVKEPQPQEVSKLTPRHTVFGYFHFASSLPLIESCLEAGFTALAYETLFDARGTLPLLIPMSEVAGRLAIQSGAKYLERPTRGRGVLLGGVPGTERGNVLVLGAGIVGTEAARVAAGFGANVVVMDINLERLRYLDATMPPNVTTLFSDPEAIASYLPWADLVVGAILLPGRRAPKLIQRADLQRMKPGSVLVDVCIDQGGCAETSRPTTHSQPIFIEQDVVHYCVTNMPGAVGRTSTHALCNATLPYVRQLARLGTDAFLSQAPGLGRALNMRHGQIEAPELRAASDELKRAFVHSTLG